MDNREKQSRAAGPEREQELISRLGEGSPFDHGEAFLVRAPLRICPLGAHVDHQGGIVTGMTVDREVTLAAIPAPDAAVRVTSLDFPGEVSVDLRHEIPEKTGDWGDYLRAAVSSLSSAHRLHTGLWAVVGGDLPGAGLSSSAAVLISYLLALARVNEIDLGPEEISSLVQRAENEYIGVESGRLDQSIILFAEPQRLTRVDCSDLSIDQVSLPEDRSDFRVLVAFSGVSRALAGSGFNTRVEECREAARLLLELAGRPPSAHPVLSEVDPEIFERYVADLPQVPRRRSAHYFGEQRRVQAGVEAWRQGDLARFGVLMTASGASSIQNYECGTAELITLYELLRDTPGVFGTRFSGGGFGGSCIALIDPGTGEEVVEAVRRGYTDAQPDAASAASFHICSPGGPARVVGSVG